MGSANDRQVAGDHYRSEFQHWDMLVRLGFGPEYFIGQVTKYVSRWKKKNGVRDLMKAQHFAEKLAELLDEEGLKGNANMVMPFANVDDDVRKVFYDETLVPYFRANDVGALEQTICTRAVFAADSIEVRQVVRRIAALLAGAQDKLDAEPPVAAGFDFVRYGEDSATIFCRNKETGVTKEVPIDLPPSAANWTAN